LISMRMSGGVDSGRPIVLSEAVMPISVVIICAMSFADKVRSGS
jgi:hypothetical protein